MVWKVLSRLFERESKKEKEIESENESGPEVTEIGWLGAADNAWGMPVLDVRPVTLTMLATSTDRQCAINAVSFTSDDGTSFINDEPPVSRTAEASLRFPIERVLVDGVLFCPREMEHKWALFFHRGQIICVRSWLRKVEVVARVEQHHDHIVITQVRGTFQASDEEPAFTIRVLDYLLRSHGLNMVSPAPLPGGMEEDPKAAALWCMSMFGNRALFATPHALGPPDPDRPLRTQSVLHIAVARGEAGEVERHLAAGVPIDLLAGDGLAPLHWALASEDPAITALLLDRGSPVDVRSTQGATPLMTAAQSASVDKVRLLLDRGADVNARDGRGFTALHRAAELGRLEILRLLLDRGASPDVEVGGQTPRTLAAANGKEDVVAVLDGHRAA